MIAATLLEQAAMRHADALSHVQDASVWVASERLFATPSTEAINHDTDARDTLWTARDALTAAREDHP